MEEDQDFNLTFTGCGFLGIYHIGVMCCLKANAAGFLKRVKCFGGASCGAFAAVGLVVDLNISDVAESVIKLSNRAKSFSLGPLHPCFQIVETVRRAFEKMLPDNAHEMASGKLHISLTRVPDLKNVIVSQFFSKEDLIEALVASSFVPFYSGIFPAVFRGKYYVDGGISDNLPQHFKEGETITVSPFSGESDICPKDSSSNDIHIEINYTSIQFTLENLYRFSCALFPPHEDVLSNICQQGYQDTLRFLQEHYPNFLSKELLRTPSISLDLKQTYTASSSTSSHDCASCSHRTQCSSQTLTACSSCGNAMNREDCSGSEMEEGESKLFEVIFNASNNTTETEHWSCFVIHRSLYAVKVLSKPCVEQLLAMLKIFLDSLAKMDKTGNKRIDNLLSKISMIMHTYRDNHQVQHWRRPSRFSITDFSTAAEGLTSINSVSECTQESSMSLSTDTNRDQMGERDAQALAVNSNDSDNIEVFLSNDFMRHQLQECLEECLAGSFLCLESHYEDTDSSTVEEPINTGDGRDKESHNGLEDQGGSCTEGVEDDNIKV